MEMSARRLFAEGIRKRIRYRQADLRMSQKALAEAIGMRENMLGKRINGATGWAPDELLRVAIALRVSLDYLYGITDEPGTPPDRGDDARPGAQALHANGR